MAAKLHGLSMTDITLEQALENIYASIKNDNMDLDAHIITLKKILHAKGAKTVEIDTTKLAQPNRQGRKLMQSYFKKRGVEITFSQAAA